MTRKKIAPVRKYESAKFKVEETLLKCPPKSMPLNLAEEKEKFLKSGKAPKFEVKDRAKLDELASKTKNQIRFELLGEAQYILQKVYDTYGNGEFFLEHAFGIRITKDEATPMLLKYIAENCLTESMKIHWCDNMACSAKLAWTGPMVHANRPDLRRYSLWINGSEENNYMRESGIRCLLDHEIGTHFFRSFNDGFQPWFSDRERFGLRKLGAFEGQCTEEGLAAINTVLRGRVKLLWGAALAYYTACKAAEMSFRQLFDHLGQYISNREYRWKQAMRVKRGLSDPNDLGGFGNDQCYFEGAVTILRNMDKIDFYLLMTGKVCHDELDRIKRVARKDVIRFPSFMKNMAAYRKTLRKIVSINSLNGLHPQRGPPDVYVKRLEERKNGKKSHKPKKVRSSNKLNLLAKNISDNKKRLRAHEDDETEEIDCFKCSQPFINFHIRKNNLKENILENSEASMHNVTQLSEDIVTKDSSLDKQINKLQEIVHKHPWACKEEQYRESLLKEAEEHFNGTMVFGNSECQLPLSLTEQNNCCMSKNASMECDIVADTKEINICDKVVSQNSDKSPDHDLHSSPSDSALSLVENYNGNQRSASSNSLTDVSQPPCDYSLLSKGTIVNSNRNSFGLLQKRRVTLRDTRKELFRIPVAGFTTQDTMSGKQELCQPLNFAMNKNRISVNFSKKRESSLDLLETDPVMTSSPLSTNFKYCNFERDDAWIKKDMYKKSDLSITEIQLPVDVTYLTDRQGPQCRGQDLKLKRQASSLSLSSMLSETDFENSHQNKHHFFHSSAGNKRMSAFQPTPLIGEEFVRERSHTGYHSPRMGSPHIAPAQSTACRRNIFIEDYYQPLIISSAKPLVHRAFESITKAPSGY